MLAKEAMLALGILCVFCSFAACACIGAICNQSVMSLHDQSYECQALFPLLPSCQAAPTGAVSRYAAASGPRARAACMHATVPA
jgi:hypothetical protein